MLAGESDATVRLAETVSLAVLIEPALLRRARLELERNADTGVEADVWFSTFVASRDPDGIVFHREAAEGLRRRLASSVDRRRRAWALLQQVHADTSPALQLEEEIAWLIADEADQALPKIRARLRRAIATLVGGERVGLAHWAVQAIHRLPEAVLELDETRILYTAARLRLGASSNEEEVPDWMSWVLPTKQGGKAAIRLRLFAGVLELEPVVVSDSSPNVDIIRAPAVEPLTVEIDGGDGPVPVTVHAAGPTFARIGSGVVRLRTSDDAVYELTPSHDLEQRRQREIVSFGPLLAEYEHFVVLREPLELLRSAPFKGGVGLSVTGPAGSGKTGLLAAFARSLTPPHASHFFSDRTHRWRDADLAWTSLAAQVERLSPLEPAPPSRPVERLRRALHRLPSANMAFVLVLDGLDEMSPAARAADDLDALFGGGLPRNACVICSCNTGSPIARQLRALFDGSSSLAGIALEHPQWKHARIEAAKETGLDGSMAELLDGNFLAGHLVRESFQRDAEHQAALASNLRRYAHDSPNDFDPVGAVAASAWGVLPALARTMLGIVAAAREPLTRARIADAAGVAGPDASVGFDAITSWLAAGRTPDAEDTYVVLHQALRTCIGAAGRAGTDDDLLEASHDALLNTVAKWTPRDLGEFQKEYSLRYAVTHAAGSGHGERVDALVGDLDFLDARCRLESPDSLAAELRTIADARVPAGVVHAVADALSDFIQPLRHDPGAVRFVVDMAMRAHGGESRGRPPSLRLRHAVTAPRYGFREHRGAVLGCSYLASDSIVSWSADGTLKTWRRAGLALERTLTGHTADVTSCDFADAVPGGLISGSRDGTVRLWPTAGSAVLTTHAAPVLGVEWTREGIVSWDAAGVIRVSDAATGEMQSVHEHRGAITACVVEGLQLWSGSEDHTIRVWTDLVNASVHDLTLEPALADTSEEGTVVGVVNRVLREKLLAGAREIVFDGREGTERQVAARLKIIGNLDVAERRKPQQGWVRIRIGPHVHMLKVETIPESGRESVRLTIAEQRASSTALEGHTGAVTAMTASGPLGGYMYSCSEDGTIRAWDARRLTEAGTLRGHESAVLGCEPLADSTLVSWSRDRTLRVWDLAQERDTLVLTGHRGAVLGARVLSTIGQVLSWSSDGTLRLWDARTGAPLAVLEGHRAAVNDAIVLDQASILSCSDDRSLLQWDPPIWQ